MRNTDFYREAAASCNQTCRQYLQETTLRQLLEEYRAQTDPESVEVLLCVLERYLQAMTGPVRTCVLDFVYDMLSHPDGEIRRQAASLAGRLLAESEMPVWHAFLRRILFSNVLMSEHERRWVGFALKNVLRSLLSHTPADRQRPYLRVLTEYYKSTRWDTLTCFFLMDCASSIPYALCNDSQRKMLLGFARYFLLSADRELSCAALIFTDYWLEQGVGEGLNMQPYFDLFSRISGEDPSPGMRMLARQVLHPSDPVTEEGGSDLFMRLLLANRSLETPWIIKQVNLRILRRLADSFLTDADHSAILSQYASGLLNMLQYADHIVNRLQAQEDLKLLIKDLTDPQRFDVAIELIRAIETGDANIFRYVPSSLAHVYTSLGAEHRGLLKKRLLDLIDARPARIVTAAVRTGVMILQQDTADADDFLGMLCCGLAHYDRGISLYTLYLTGHALYGSPSLSLPQKKICHAFLAEKIPCFLPKRTGRYSLLCHTAAFNGIVDFLDQCGEEDASAAAGSEDRSEMPPVAFFPGSFDPFSLGNRAVAEEIARMGFCVYLCADEFSWSRLLAPLRIRQRIMAMSVADLKNVFLFPEDVQINIADPDDLTVLRKMFDGRKVYLVAGSDVIENASAYRRAPQPGSVHTMPHIVFSRNLDLSAEAQQTLRHRLPADSIWLKLPSFYEHMNAAGIRERVFHGKDISDLVAGRVQNYIYAHNLYASSQKSMKKTAPYVRPIRVTNGVDAQTDEHWMEVVTVTDPVPYAAGLLPEGEMPEPDKRICGRIRYALADGTALIRELTNVDGPHESGALSVMQEMLMHCKMNGITRVMVSRGSAWEGLFSQFGFVPAPDADNMLHVSLARPLVLFSDTGYSIRPAYAGVPQVRENVHRAQMECLRAAAALMPGHAVIRVEAETLAFRLIQLVTEANPPSPDAAASLGAMTIVPIGRLFRNALFPGSVTKDLYVEKAYSDDPAASRITHTAGAAPLQAQVRMIRSLMRPVILVDDIYSLDMSGASICSLFTDENTPVSQFLVGIHTGSASSGEQTVPVPLRAVYSIPDAAMVLEEAQLYPFLGGDSVQGEEALTGTFCVNPILPYRFPDLPDEVTTADFYRFSAVCLRNALSICRALEREYLQGSGRRLTLPHLQDVFSEVRIPDTLSERFATDSKTPSELLMSEQKRLERLQTIR